MNKKEIKEWLNSYNIINYRINSDLTVDVDGPVNLYRRNLTSIPIQFGKVTGYFDCDYNNLQSLEGCPEKVGGSFYCSYNKLQSLKWCPTKIGGNFACHHNNLTTLEYKPEVVKIKIFYVDILTYYNLIVKKVWTLDDTEEIPYKLMNVWKDLYE